MKAKSLYWRLLDHVKPYWRVFTLAIVAMVVLALTEPLLPALLKPLLDGGFVEKDPALMQWIPVLLILLALVRGIAGFITQVSMTWVASMLVTDLRQRMFARLLSLPTHRYDNCSSGVLMSKVTYDVSRVMLAATDALIILVRDSLAVIGLLAWMFYLDWQLSLIVFSIVPLIMGVVKISSVQLRKINQALQNMMGNMTQILEEVISGHKLVKIFAGQNYEARRFAHGSDQVRQFEVKVQVTSQTTIFIIQMLTALVLAAIIYIATQKAGAERISVGSFISLFTAMGMLFAPIKRLTKVNEQLQQGLAAAESVFSLMDEPAECDSGTHHIHRLSGQIDFYALNFNYNGDKSILKNLELNIHAGETIALVGASGSGKTTLAHLIARFYDLPADCLRFDAIDVNSLPLADLRANIALVSQDVVLFNDTVAANIAYGSLAETDEARIIQAAKAAHAWEFIEQLPQGLKTPVGERGTKLSGGQRQRLAIARAFLKDAPILIFDEATSALDNVAEAQVQDSLEHLRQNRTTVIIAHRLSTIKNANRIVVLDQGEIKEIGNHNSLMAKGGIYAKLYQAHQLGNQPL
jgi:subfamily B ATP-binding cassette protein MsbA